MWVANEFDGSITAIDPSRDHRLSPFRWVARRLRSRPSGDDLWLAVGASATEHRGGTLTVSSVDTRRPTVARPRLVVYDDEIAGQILAITNDGLLSFKKVGGADGATLVPDLASALPEVSADGLTYRFPLREGIRYSTGDPVRPEDFRHALERAITLKRDDCAGCFSAIDGARGLLEDPSTCDLSDSIVVDAGAVTFHPRAPGSRPAVQARAAVRPSRSRSRPRSRTRGWPRPGDGTVHDRGGRSRRHRTGAEPEGSHEWSRRGAARRLRGRDLVAVRRKRRAEAFDRLERR